MASPPHLRPVRGARIAFVINSLAGGGAERIFCRLILSLAERLREWDAHVVLLDDEPRAYSLPDYAQTHQLSARGNAPESVALLLHLMRTLRPDIAVSFLSRANCANILAGQWLGYGTVISERVATTQHLAGGPKGFVNRATARLLYPRAHSVVAVSQGVGRELVERFGVSSSRIRVIPNPVDCDEILSLSQRPIAISLPDRFIVSVGRLTPNKNFALLLEAFARAQIPHELIVLGEGSERGRLEAKAQALGVSGRVHFLGFMENPFAIMRRAEMFASASNVEGFPNALVEAMALGLPAAHTNCPAGPAEILADDADLKIASMHATRFGVLSPVGDAESLAASLRFLAAPANRKLYAARALQRARCFEPSRIAADYWSVISEVAARRRRSQIAAGAEEERISG